MTCSAVLVTVLYSTLGPLQPLKMSYDEQRFAKPGQCERAIASWQHSKSYPRWRQWSFVKRREQPHLYLKRCVPCDPLDGPHTPLLNQLTQYYTKDLPRPPH